MEKTGCFCAINATEIVVNFSEEIDAVTAANFSIAGAGVSAAAFGEDHTEVVLTVDGVSLGSDYTLTVTGIAVSGETQDDITFDFTMDEAGELFDLTLEYADEDEVLKADGADSTLVTVKLVDAEGNTIANQKDVVLAFTTTFGSFSEQRVAVQNGEATNMLTSEYLTSDKTANIRAVVVEAADASLIGEEISSTILLSPNPDSGDDDNVGASLTDAEANKADRVVLYFNKDVDVADYLVADTEAQVDPTKALIKVDKDTKVENAGSRIPVVGIKAVPGNTKALEVILDTTDADFPLVDNSDVWVEFTDLTGTVDVTKSTSFVLTDSRQPEMLSVTNDSLNSLVIKFSEPVDSTTATNPTNWAIDGIALDVTYTFNVGTFNAVTGSDLRHVVTIDLPAGEYFTAGDHSVQAANIRDWAGAIADVNGDAQGDSRNVMETQTLDFYIAADTAQPSATVEVQSPEQYLVKFDKTISENAAGIIAAAGDVEIQRYNTTTSTWDSYEVLVAASNDNDALDFSLTDLPDNEFLIEADLDWTVVYNTATSNKNYYNDRYRLHIPADTVTNVANGLKNAEINIELDGPMTSPDTTSPTIVDIEEAAVGYNVTMSEPVKLSAAANTEFATDSQAQGYNAGDAADAKPGSWDNIPVPTAEFIKTDNSVTIPGTVGAAFVANSYETVLNVQPATALTPGEWTLVIRSISDDVGNTAPSATRNFTVEGVAPVDTDFEVLWSFADIDHDLVVEDTDGAEADTNYDYVFVKFSQPVAVTGDYKNATKTTNYTLDGDTLPSGTQIFANIAGYDNLDNVTDSVTIRLPQGTLDDVNAPHALNISAFIENKDGDRLANPGERTLEYDNYNVDMATDIAADLTARILVDTAETAKDTALATMNGANLDAFETAYENAKTAIDALATNNSLVAEQYQAAIDSYKAELLADAGLTFDVTQATATTIGVALAGTAVADVSDTDEYTVEYSASDLIVVDESDLTAAITVDVADTNTTADSVVVTITDKFWGVDDTVTVNTAADDSTVTVEND